VPAALRRLYATAFEVEPKWLVEAGARRQKWIDSRSRSISTWRAPSARSSTKTYKLAWIRGLKTTYYLRAMGATHAENRPPRRGSSTRYRGGRHRGAVCADEAKFCAVDTPIARPASDHARRPPLRRAVPPALWSAPRSAGLYALMVPGLAPSHLPRGSTSGQAEDFSARELLGGHPRYREWLAIAGTDWNLYIATYAMSTSTPAQREGRRGQIAREYRPEFNYPAPTPETPSLKAFMLGRRFAPTRTRDREAGAMLKFEELAVQPTQGFVPLAPAPKSHRQPPSAG